MGDVSNVVCQMREAGLTGLSEADLIIDGKIHRFRPEWEHQRGKKRGYYVLFLFQTDHGQQHVTGAFGWFKGADLYSFNVALSVDRELTSAELARLKNEQYQNRKLAEQEREQEALSAAKRAAEIWSKLPKRGHSPYLQRKKVAAFGVRYSRGSIVLPVQDIAGVLCGLQFIDADGNKKFLTGTIKKGRFFPLGKVVNHAGFIGIAEGYATGASVRMATRWPVFVAFDAGNLQPVAQIVRQAYQQAIIVICGDDDLDNPDNPGRTKAEQAAEAVGGIAVFPAAEAPA